MYYIWYSTKNYHEQIHAKRITPNHASLAAVAYKRLCWKNKFYGIKKLSSHIKSFFNINVKFDFSREVCVAHVHSRQRTAFNVEKKETILFFFYPKQHAVF